MLIKVSVVPATAFFFVPLLLFLLLLFFFFFFFFSSFSSLPPPPHCEALHSVVGLGFQYNISPFPTVCDRCLPFLIPFILKSSSNSSLRLLRGLLLFLLFPLRLLKFVLTFFSFASFHRDRAILEFGIS